MLCASCRAGHNLHDMPSSHAALSSCCGMCLHAQLDGMPLGANMPRHWRAYFHPCQMPWHTMACHAMIGRRTEFRFDKPACSRLYVALLSLSYPRLMQWRWRR